jgi:membrane protease YdiL (CAAX protease family)
MNIHLKTSLYILLGLVGFFMTSILSGLVLILNQSIVSYLIQMVLSIFLSIFVIQTLCKKFHHIELIDIEIGKLSNMFLWLLCALLLPLLLAAFFIFLIPGHFKYTELNTVQLFNKIGMAIFLIGISTAVTEELWFRGYTMKIIEKNTNKNISIIISAIIFSILHIINIRVEYNFFDVLLLIINGTIVGIMLALIVHKSYSIWPAIIVHIFCNIITGGILHIGINENEIALFNFILENDMNIITGGNIGYTISLPATIGYVIVIIKCMKKI